MFLLKLFSIDKKDLQCFFKIILKFVEQSSDGNNFYDIAGPFQVPGNLSYLKRTPKNESSFER